MSGCTSESKVIWQATNVILQLQGIASFAAALESMTGSQPAFADLCCFSVQSMPSAVQTIEDLLQHLQHVTADRWGHFYMHGHQDISQPVELPMSWQTHECRSWWNFVKPVLLQVLDKSPQLEWCGQSFTTNTRQVVIQIMVKRQSAGHWLERECYHVHCLRAVPDLKTWWSHPVLCPFLHAHAPANDVHDWCLQLILAYVILGLIATCHSISVQRM